MSKDDLQSHTASSSWCVEYGFRTTQTDSNDFEKIPENKDLKDVSLICDIYVIRDRQGTVKMDMTSTQKGATAQMDTTRRSEDGLKHMADQQSKKVNEDFENVRRKKWIHIIKETFNKLAKEKGQVVDILQDLLAYRDYVFVKAETGSLKIVIQVHSLRLLRHLRAFSLGRGLSLGIQQAMHNKQNFWNNLREEAKRYDLDVQEVVFSAHISEEDLDLCEMSLIKHQDAGYLSDEGLADIACLLDEKWRQLVLELGVTEQEVKSCIFTHPNDKQAAKRNALYIWRSKNKLTHDQTMEQLRAVLSSVGRPDLADFINKSSESQYTQSRVVSQRKSQEKAGEYNQYSNSFWSWIAAVGKVGENVAQSLKNLAGYRNVDTESESPRATVQSSCMPKEPFQLSHSGSRSLAVQPVNSGDQTFSNVSRAETGKDDPEVMKNQFCVDIADDDLEECKKNLTGIQEKHAAVPATEDHQNLFDQSDVVAAASKGFTFQSLPPSSTPSHVWEIDPCMTEDKSVPAMTGLVITRDTMPVLVSVDHNNSCVKGWWQKSLSKFGKRQKKESGWRSLFGRKEKSVWKQNRMSLNGEPRSVTLLSHDIVVVSLPYERQLCVIRVTPSFVLQFTAKTQKEYFALATISSDTVAAITKSSSNFGAFSIDIIHPDGACMRTIDRLDWERIGNLHHEIFNEICVTKCGNLVVSGFYEGRLSCVSQTGEPRWTNAISVKCPTCVTNDEPYLYVTDRDCDVVWRLSLNGDKICECVTGEKHGVWGPWSVFAYHGHLFVSHYTSSSRQSGKRISIFQL